MKNKIPPPRPPKARKISDIEGRSSLKDKIKSLFFIIFMIGLVTVMYMIWFPLKSYIPFKILGTCFLLGFILLVISLNDKSEKEVGQVPKHRTPPPPPKKSFKDRIEEKKREQNIKRN